MSTAKDFTKAIQDAVTSKTSAYDTTAEVMRVEGDTVWVHIPGGVDETPVKRTIDAKVGDTVQVRVGGGSAWLVGNASAPPTDDTTANVAKGVATSAHKSAVIAEETAEVAEALARGASENARMTSQYFWHTQTDTGAGAGAHVTEIPQEDFLDDPDNGGGNVLLTSTGMDVRDGTDVLATFGANGAQIGKDTRAHSIIDSLGQRFYASNGTTQLANIGYGPGSTSSGTTATAPYYTLGTRRSGQAVGNYSMAEGYETRADGYASHVEGSYTTASGSYAHAEGFNAIATSFAAHSEGEQTQATARATHAQNLGTIAAYQNQTALGRYNINQQLNAFELGNGTGENDRQNAAVIKWDGEARFAGDVYVGCDYDSTGGVKLLPIHTQTFSKATGNVPASSYLDITVNVAVTGYTPVGIIGIKLTGTGTAALYISEFSINGTDAEVTLRNSATAARSGTIAVTALYVKS